MLHVKAGAILVSAKFHLDVMLCLSAYYFLLKALKTYFLNYVRCGLTRTQYYLPKFGRRTREISVLAVLSPVWFEMGGAQLEKDDITIFSAPFKIQQVVGYLLKMFFFPP